MEELKVIINQKNGVIDFSNCEELKGQLSEYLEEYRIASFTEESKGAAKDKVAELRKLKKSVNDRKIEVKKLHMQPYNVFEEKTKELLALIDEPINLIESQIKTFEAKRLADRKVLIKSIFDQKVGDMSEFVNLNSIYSEKWENVSTSKKKIEEEIDQALLGIRIDVESLKIMRVDSDIVEYALNQYKRGNSAIESMRKANEFAELTERRRRMEEETKAAREAREAQELQKAHEAEEARKAVTAQEAAAVKADRETREDVQIEDSVKDSFSGWESFAVSEPEPQPESDESGFDLPFVTPSIKSVKYRVAASENELEELEMYMNSAGLSFERIN